MSNLIKELKKLPQWDDLDNKFHEILSDMRNDILDDIDASQIKEILESRLDEESFMLVAHLIVHQLYDEWLEESKKKFDRFLTGLKEASKK